MWHSALAATVVWNIPAKAGKAWGEEVLDIVCIVCALRGLPVQGERRLFFAVFFGLCFAGAVGK